MSGVIRGFRKVLYVAAGTESPFGGGATLTHWFKTLGDGPAPRRDITAEDDAGQATGEEYPINQYVLERTSDGSVSMRACAESLAIFGAFAWGRDTVTQPGGNDYQHALSEAPLDESLGSTVVEHHADGATYNSNTDVNLRGISVDQFELSGGRRGFVNMRVGYLGSGRAGTAANQDHSALRSNGPLFPTNKVLISIASLSTEHSADWDGTYTPNTGSLTLGQPQSLATNLGSSVDRWRFLKNNNHDQASRFGAGTSASQGIYTDEPVINRRGAMLDVTLRENSTTTGLLKALINSSEQNNAEYAVLISGVSDYNLTDGAAQFNILLPICGIRSTPRNSGGLGIQTDSYTFFAKKDQSGNDRAPALMWVMNSYSVTCNQAP